MDNTPYISRQTILSIIILMILSFVALCIFFTQKEFYPAVNVFKQAGPDALKEPIQKKDETSVMPIIDNVAVLTPLEIFDFQTLSDKINGKAELYLSAGFKELKSQRFKFENHSDDWFETYLFDMETTLNAFAVFSSQRRENASPLDLGSDAYYTENAVYLTHGKFYIEMIASAPLEQHISFMIKMAKAFIGNTAVKKESVTLKDYFPKEHLVKDSIAVLAKNAFGFDGFNQVYIARYKIQNITMTSFILKCQNPKKAQNLKLKYQDMLVSFGGKVISSEDQADTLTTIEIMDLYEILFLNGSFLAGIHEASDKKLAIELARDLKTHIERKINDIQ